MFTPQFVPSTDTGVKVMCTTCGRSGSDLRRPDGSVPPGRSWMDDCLKPHTHQCTCGKAFPKRAGLSAHLGTKHPRKYMDPFEHRAVS